jgi:ribosomal protein L11 methyltransferase
VDHDDLAVARELHVELDHLGTEGFGAAEGAQRVLGSRPAGAAMCDDEHGGRSSADRALTHHGGRAACAEGSARRRLTCGQTAAKLAAVSSDPEWTALRVEVASAAADAVANFLVERGAPGILTEDADGDVARTRLEAHVPAATTTTLVAALRAYLHELARLDSTWTAGAVEVLPVPAVDWEGVFRAHHVPIAIGRRLLVAPPWDVPEAPGREVLVIEPGMAFGTGQHATTRTCLEEIEARVASRAVRSALDVGTGSGLLAAALARLGVPRVVALDVDPTVLPLARANVDANGARHVTVLGGTLAAVRGRYDLVVANILADTLVDEAAALAAAVASGGHLVLSGILTEQAPRVLAAFPGWRATSVRADEPWRTLGLEREP